MSRSTAREIGGSGLNQGQSSHSTLKTESWNYCCQLRRSGLHMPRHGRRRKSASVVLAYPHFTDFSGAILLDLVQLHRQFLLLVIGGNYRCQTYTSIIVKSVDLTPILSFFVLLLCSP